MVFRVSSTVPRSLFSGIYNKRTGLLLRNKLKLIVLITSGTKAQVHGSGHLMDAHDSLGRCGLGL